MASPRDNDDDVAKYGLEVGLLRAMTTPQNETQRVKPGDLLKRYGGAYLATSVTLSLGSYALCYYLVDAGIDVSALLEKIGIHSAAAGVGATTTTTAGTAAIAYAFHKAASPIRFPPTVALTPVVASWLGKKEPDTKEHTQKIFEETDSQGDDLNK